MSNEAIDDKISIINETGSESEEKGYGKNKHSYIEED